MCYRLIFCLFVEFSFVSCEKGLVVLDMGLMQQPLSKIIWNAEVLFQIMCDIKCIIIME